MWNELTFLWNELTILWNDLTTDLNDLTWNDLTVERNGNNLPDTSFSLFGQIRLSPKQVRRVDQRLADH